MNLVTLLILLLVLGIVFGGYGTRRGDWGYWGWFPSGLILVILILVLVGVF